MKKRTIILAVLNFVLPFCAFAQLTVQETGKVEIGQEQDMPSITPANRDTVTTLKLYGTGAKFGTFKAEF